MKYLILLLILVYNFTPFLKMNPVNKVVNQKSWLTLRPPAFKEHQERAYYLWLKHPGWSKEKCWDKAGNYFYQIYEPKHSSAGKKVLTLFLSEKVYSFSDKMLNRMTRKTIQLTHTMKRLGGSA